MRVYREVVSAARSRDLNSLSKAILGRWNKGIHHILTLTSSLMATTVVTSGIGFVYWWVAARRFPPASVGFAAAAVSAMTLLGTVSMLGLGTLLMGELPRRPQQAGPLITTGLLAAGTAGMVLGVLVAVAAPAVSPGLGALAQDVGSVLLFALGVCLTAITLVLDQALLGLLRGQLQFLRNALFAVIKLVALMMVGLVLVSSLGMSIYATWVAGMAISLLGLVGIAAFKGERLRVAYPRWTLLRGIGRAAVGHHALNLALQAPPLMIPVVVTAILSTTVNAYFYTTNMVASFLSFVPFALSLSLYAVSAATPLEMPRRVRFTLALAGVVGVLANIFLVVGADMVLGLFGPAYAQHASASLRIMGLSVFPLIIKDHYIAIHRVRNRLASAASIVIAGAVVEVVLAGVGAHLGGLAGLCTGWLVAQCGEAIVMAPAVYRVAADTAPATQFQT